MKTFMRAARRYLALLNMDPDVLRERNERRPPGKEKKEVSSWVHAALFLLTLLTTTLAGADGRFAWKDILESGLPFSLTLMTILIFHEMGHYAAARRFGLRATLPFFIPLPHFISPIGTLGAVIKIRSPLRERRALLWIGASGPLAGFIVSLAAVVVGMFLSEARPVPVLPPDSFLLHFGDSLLFRVIALLVIGPIAPGHDVFLSPVAWAGWIGFLVTSLNLMPIGQLDGGHIMHALLGRRQLIAGWAGFIILLFFCFFWVYWIVWIFLVLLFLRVGHPAIDDATPLGRGERASGWLCMAILILTFIPVPVVPVENDSIFPFRCEECPGPLEPSGLTMMNGRLLLVSDSDKKIYEAVKDPGGYRAFPVLTLRGLRPGAHGTDLEGIAQHRNVLYLVDERNRRIFTADASGRTALLPHDIGSYNSKHMISFSPKPNAAFEGIAIEASGKTAYILNEREPCIIYRLTLDDGKMTAESHFIPGPYKGTEIRDASDIFADGGHLYLLHRKGDRIIKIDPKTWRYCAEFSFRHIAARMYISPKGYGFAEGLFMDRKKIYLAFDGNGKTMRDGTSGIHGALVIVPRPKNF